MGYAYHICSMYSVIINTFSNILFVFFSGNLLNGKYSVKCNSKNVATPQENECVSWFNGTRLET